MNSHLISKIAHRPASNTKRAFTLIELLIVIAIIGVLMSFLLPVLGQSKTLMFKTLCTTHQRGIAQALFVYEGDYKTMPAFGTHDGLGVTGTTNPYDNPFGGGVIWGPVPRAALGLPFTTASTTNGPIGVGMLIQDNYMPIALAFCPQYDDMYDLNNVDQGPTNNWHKRTFMWGQPYAASSAAVNAYPNSDGLGLPSGSVAFLRSDYNYRGGDWSTTGSLTVLTGPVNAVPANLRSSSPDFAKHSLLTDWRYWYHPTGGGTNNNLGGNNVAWGDGSVTWMDKTRWGSGGPNYHNLFSGGGQMVYIDASNSGNNRNNQGSYLPTGFMDQIDIIGR